MPTPPSLLPLYLLCNCFLYWTFSFDNNLSTMQTVLTPVSSTGHCRILPGQLHECASKCVMQTKSPTQICSHDVMTIRAIGEIPQASRGNHVCCNFPVSQPLEVLNESFLATHGVGRLTGRTGFLLYFLCQRPKEGIQVRTHAF